MYGHVSISYVFSGLCLRLIQLGAIFDACMGIAKPDHNEQLARDASLLGIPFIQRHRLPVESDAVFGV